MPKVFIFKGFTFIELLIVISTMALLFSLGFSNYRGYQQRQRIVNAARILRSDLRFTQEQALAGIKPDTCGILNGYRLTYSTPTEYQVSANCDDGTNNVDIKTISLASSSSGIQFSSAFPLIFFNVLGRGVKMPGASIPITLIDIDSSPNPTLTITITKGGEIN